MKPISRRHFVRLGGATAAVALGKTWGAAAAPSEVDVIIIGAGSFGCNAAWHLHERGRKVLVLEAQDRPATQASRAGAGFVALWSGVHIPQWGKLEWEMQRYGIDFYTRLARECETDIGFAPCGISYIYLTSKGWEDVQPRSARARSFGTRLESLTPQRSAKLLPVINFKSTTGILFDSDAIRVRAGDAIRCEAEHLARQGVQFKYNTPVTSLVREGERVVGVATNSGKYHAAHVVITAGAWSRRLVESVGAKCPTNAMADTRYTTPPLGVPSTLPLLIYSDAHEFYIRYEHDGLLIGGDDKPVDALNPPFAASIPKDGAYRVRKQIREIEQVMPVLKHAEVDEVRSGVASYTDDLHFILDAVPRLPGLFVITACLEAGITHGPALGKMMAELIVDGHTQLDRAAFRLTRFDSGKAERRGPWMSRKQLIGVEG